MSATGAKVHLCVVSRTMSDDDEYMSQQEAADALGVKVRRIQQMRTRGQIVAEVSGNRRVRFKRTEVDRVKRDRETFRPVR